MSFVLAACHLPLTHFSITLPRQIFLNSPLGSSHSLQLSRQKPFFVSILPDQTLSFAARHQTSHLITSSKQVKSSAESKR